MTTNSETYRYKGHDYHIRQRGDSWQADFGTVNGKRRMKSWKTKAAAENWLRQEHNQQADFGVAAFQLSTAQRADAVRALEIVKAAGLKVPALSVLEYVAKTYCDAETTLRKCNASIQDAVALYQKFRPPVSQQRTLKAVADEYIEDGKAHNLREASIHNMEVRLRRLVAHFPDRLVSEITREDARNYCNSIPGSQATRHHYRIHAHGMYQYAIDAGYVADNPFAMKKHRRQYHIEQVMPTCMKWADVQKVMLAAAEHEPSMVPALAIGFFAGLRTAEIKGLDWSAIDLKTKRIMVSPETAKKRRTRYVAIEPNLGAWLAPHYRSNGLVAPEGMKWRFRFDNVIEKAGVTWVKNSMRHSFASHHYAAYGDAMKTANELGHRRDVDMLFEHYRGLVDKQDGEAYFKIMPLDAGNSVIQFPQTASA